MATTYVPVPFPAWSPRNSTRAGSSIPLRNAADETPAGDGGTTGGSVGWTESPVSLKLVGYEILEKRSKFTVLTYTNREEKIHFVLPCILNFIL